MTGTKILSIFVFICSLFMASYSYSGELQYPFGLSPNISMAEAKKILTRQEYKFSEDKENISINEINIGISYFNAEIHFKNDRLYYISIESTLQQADDSHPSIASIKCISAYESLLKNAVVKYGAPTLTFENRHTNYRPSYLWAKGNTLVKLEYGCLLSDSSETASLLTLSELDSKIFPKK